MNEKDLCKFLPCDSKDSARINLQLTASLQHLLLASQVEEPLYVPL